MLAPVEERVEVLGGASMTNGGPTLRVGAAECARTLVPEPGERLVGRCVSRCRRHATSVAGGTRTAQRAMLTRAIALAPRTPIWTATMSPIDPWKLYRAAS